MGKNIAYQNKDITSKIFADNFKEKSLSVYGLDIPKIVQVLPTNLPVLEVNELRIDNLFLLEDGTIAIIDYESTYSKKNKLKYLNYITRVVKRYQKEGIFDLKIRMIVIYTADVKSEDVSSVFNVGCLKLETQDAFLSELNSEEIWKRLEEKVNNGISLTDDELMEFIILPLTYPHLERKKASIKNTIDLAKNINNEADMVFVLSGILVFSDKIIDKETSKIVKEWISMTKVGRLFAEEKEEAVREAEMKAAQEKREAALKLLKKGMSVDDIADVLTVSTDEVLEIAQNLIM